MGCLILLQSYGLSTRQRRIPIVKAVVSLWLTCYCAVHLARECEEAASAPSPVYSDSHGHLHNKSEGAVVDCLNQPGIHSRATLAHQIVAPTSLVVVVPTSTKRFDIAKAARSWRGKVPAHYILDKLGSFEKWNRNGDVFHESFTVQPDVVGFRRPHEYRYAWGPILAHKYLGQSYDWMLFGDDDTVWSLGGVTRLLADYDPSLPYLISDNFWNGLEAGSNDIRAAVNPSRTAPRCLPCHVKAENVDLSSAAMLAVPGCPCTPEEACAPVQLPTQGLWTREACLRQDYRFHIFGGTGMILSRGLLDAWTSKELQYMACVERNRLEFGDAIISRCLFELGFAATDPGPFLLAPGSRPPLFGSYNHRNKPLTPGDLQAVMQHVQSGNASNDEVRVLLWMVSMHVKSRKLNNTQQGSPSGRRMSAASQAVHHIAQLLHQLERMRAHMHHKQQRGTGSR